MDQVPPPLDQLIGQELNAVTFVRDYFQVQFNPPPIINIMTSVTLQSATGIVSQTDSAFPGAIIAQIGKSITGIVFDIEKFFRLVFSDGSQITVSLKPQDFVGAEALNYIGATGEWGIR